MRSLNNEKSRPAKTAYIQTAQWSENVQSSCTGKNWCVRRKVAQWPSGPVVQRPSGPAAQRPSGPADQRTSGLATKRHTTQQQPIQIPPVQPRRATEKALGYYNINLWLCNHHNQQSYSNNLFSHSVYEISIQPRCIYYSLWWSEICRAPRYANAPSYYQNKQSKELLGYQ